MRKEIKNCPKCGEPDYHAKANSWFGGEWGVGSSVTCPKCGTRYDTWHKITGRPKGILIIIPR